MNSLIPYLFVMSIKSLYIQTVAIERQNCGNANLFTTLFETWREGGRW